MKSMVQGYKDAGAKYGIKVVTANTNNDQAKETELIQTYISQGVTGIAIAPLSQDASIPNLKEAASKGIQVAITNMNLAGDIPSWQVDIPRTMPPMARSLGKMQPNSSKPTSKATSILPRSILTIKFPSSPRRAGVVSSPAWTRRRKVQQGRYRQFPCPG